jgi:hypothetical protein
MGLPLSNASYWLPDYEGGSAWSEHVPFAFWLVDALRPGMFVELGTETGVSYLALCQAVAGLGIPATGHAIDTWEGDEHTGFYGEEIFERLSVYHERHYAEFSRLVRSTFDDAVGHFEEGSIDLLHIDGLHTYDAVRHDFETWRQKLSTRAVVLLHDSNVRERGFGVHRFWSELRGEYPSFEFVHGHGLGVLGVGDDLPPEVRALLEIERDLERLAGVRRVYARLGESVRLAWQLAAAREALQEQQLHAVEQEERLQLHVAEQEERLRLHAEQEERLRSLAAEQQKLLRRSELAEKALEAGRKAAGERERTLAEREAEVAAAAQYAELQAARAAELEQHVVRITNSESWRLTAPLRFAGRTLRRVLGRGQGEPPAVDPEPPPVEPATDGRSVEELRQGRFRQLRPLDVFPVPGDGRRRLTIVTDSLSAGSLFGGVGTALIAGALLAERLDASLRIVTRLEPPEPTAFATVLRAHGIPWEANVEFVFSTGAGEGRDLPVHTGDIFLTTSWWSTWAALRAVDPASIVYLLQEDERLFYPAGDEQLLCGEVLSDDRIRFLINTKMLFDYFVGEGFASIETRGLAFEPAFPSTLYFPAPRTENGRRTFFFYARPNNVRNLFIRGLEAIQASLLAGDLSAEEWDFHFVGKDIPPLTLPHGVKPTCSENLPWPDYAALIRRADVGLSLISSPHPSYPPLDLAASGAVAVTNRFGLKQSLEQYSANIICAEPSTQALTEAISRAVELAADDEQRRRNRSSDGLSRDWHSSLAPVLDALAGTL